jgi:hypothetical protein
LHVCREVLKRWWRFNPAEVVAPVCWWLSWCFCCYFAGPRAFCLVWGPRTAAPVFIHPWYHSCVVQFCNCGSVHD